MTMCFYLRVYSGTHSCISILPKHHKTFYHDVLKFENAMCSRFEDHLRFPLFNFLSPPPLLGAFCCYWGVINLMTVEQCP